MRVSVETDVLGGFLVRVGQSPGFVLASVPGVPIEVAFSIAILSLDQLIEQELVDFDVTVIHHQVLGEEVLQGVSIDYLELTVFLESVNHLVHPCFKLAPVLLESLDFGLSHAQVLIEFLEVIVHVDLLIVLVGCDLLQLFGDLFGELTGLLRETFLHFEEIPIGSDTFQHLVEELVKVLPQGVSDLDDMFPEGYLMLLKILAYLPLHKALRFSHLLKGLLYLLLQRRLEVELVDTVQRDDWMQQVVSVETPGADLLLALEAEQDVVLLVQQALLLVERLLRDLLDYLRLLHLLLFTTRLRAAHTLGSHMLQLHTDFGQVQLVLFGSILNCLWLFLRNIWLSNRQSRSLEGRNVGSGLRQEQRAVVDCGAVLLSTLRITRLSLREASIGIQTLPIWCDGLPRHNILSVLILNHHLLLHERGNPVSIVVEVPVEEVLVLEVDPNRRILARHVRPI